MEAIVDAHSIAPTCDNSVVYFFADGDTYDSYESDFDAYVPTWNAFISDNNIELHTIGVNCSSLEDLDTIAAAGNIDSLYVDDIDDLDGVVANMATATTSLSGNAMDNIDFNEDGAGSITSIEVDGTAYTSDTFPQNGLTTINGSVLTFNFVSGAYTYSACQSDFNGMTTEVFKVNAVDADNDITSFDITINVDAPIVDGQIIDGGDDITGTINTGAGDDIINVEKDIEDHANINTGAGDDIINVGKDIDGHAIINTGMGDDTINVVKNIEDDAQIDMGTGFDTLSLEDDSIDYGRINVTVTKPVLIDTPHISKSIEST